MHLEKVYRLVHNLTKQDKTNFSAFCKGKRSTQAYKLYAILRKFNTYDERVSRELAKADFSDSSTFAKTKVKLAKLIIASLASYRFEQVPFRSFVLCSFLYDFPEIGNAAINDKLRDLRAKHDYAELIALLHWIEELKVLYSFTISLFEEFQAKEEFEHFLAEKTMLHSYIGQIRASRSKGKIERQELSNDILQRTGELEKADTFPILKHKIHMNLAFLRGDLFEAFSVGEQLTELLISNRDKQPTSLIVRELRMIALNAMYLNDPSTALKYIFRIGSLTTQFPFEERLIKISKVTISASFARKFCKIDVAKSCLAELESIREPDQFPGYDKVFWSTAMTFFYCQSFDIATRLFETAVKLTPAYRWQAHLAIAIILIESDPSSEVDNRLRRAENHAKDLGDTLFPFVAIRAVKNYWRSPLDETHSALNEGLESVLQLLQDEKEKRVSYDFPIQIWIQSKLLSTSLKEQVLEASDNSSTKDRLPIAI